MRYTVRYSEKAGKELKKLDKGTRALIFGWVEKNLEGCENPYRHGKALTANFSGYWRYRVGDYRLLCEIRESDITIYVIRVRHRREIYREY